MPTPVIGGGRPKSSVALAPAPVIRSGRASPSVGPSAGSNVGDSGRVQGEKKERPKGLRFGMVIDEPSAAPRSLALVPEGDAEPAGSGPKWGAGSVGFAGDKGESTARGRSKTAFAELENGEERRGRGRVRVMSGAGSSQMQGDDEEEGDEKGKGGSVVGGMLPWRRRGRSVAKSKVEGSEVDAESRHGWGRVKSRLWGRSVAKSKFEGSEVDDDGSVRPKRKSRMWGGSEAGEDGDARKKWGKGKSVKTAQGARSVRMRKRFTFFGMMGRDSSDEDDQ